MRVKLLVLSVLAFAGIQTTQAQFSIGVKAGANVTKVDGKSYTEQFRYGYHLGGFVHIGGADSKLAIQPEILFNQYNTKLDSNYKQLYQGVFKSGQNIKLSYLSIPILLNYNLLGKNLVLQAGPQFGVLLDNSKTLLQNSGDAFKKGDFSMVGGLQAKVSSLRVSARYFVGLNNISDLGNDDKWKNQGFQLSVGLAL